MTGQSRTAFIIVLPAPVAKLPCVNYLATVGRRLSLSEEKSMPFEIKPATRQGVLPLVGFYGRSGSGKTMSALLFARGIVGPKGRIVLIDSENRRGSIFSDQIPGGYSVIDIEPPFSPDRYVEAIEAAEQAADCVVIDSQSHSWGGEGGVLDMQEAELDRMAGNDWGKREKCKMASWIRPKLAHKQMVMRLLRSRVALIICLRGEEKTHIVKENGQNKVITDEFSSPLFDQRFIFELLLNLETVAVNGVGGYVIPRKITHPDIAKLLPGKNQQIGIEHGENLARWCAAAGTTATIMPPTSKDARTKQNVSQGVLEVNQPVKSVGELEIELWRVLKPIRTKDKKGWDECNKWLWREEILDPAKDPVEQLPGLSTEKLLEVIEKSKAIIALQNPTDQEMAVGIL